MRTRGRSCTLRLNLAKEFFGLNHGEKAKMTRLLPTLAPLSIRPLAWIHRYVVSAGFLFLGVADKEAGARRVKALDGPSRCRLPLPLQQTPRRIFLEASRLFYIAMHGAVVAPAALALDGLEIGAGPVGAGGHAAAQAVAR